jgi:hypothetical protein
MARREYTFRRGLKWQLWENIAMVGAFPAAVVVMGVLGLDLWTTVGFALAFAIIAAFIAWDRLWIFRNLAQRVIVDEAGIEAEPFYGKPVAMAWDEIVVRQEYARRDPFRGTFPQVRLVGHDGSRIVIDGEMEASDDLMRQVRAKSPHASHGPERRWWERIFLPG